MKITIKKNKLIASVAMALALGSIGVASAEGLRDALGAAYSTNPDLQAQRAGLRVTDERVSRATAGFLPTIRGTANLSKFDRESTTEGFDPTTSTGMGETYSARYDQNIFAGFQTFNSRKEAKSLVDAGRSQLQQIEQQVLLNTVTAYMDVYKDTAVLELNEKNVTVLERQLQASQDRFRVGEITRTGVAQSEARLAGAFSARISAEANLAGSRAIYKQMVGDNPGSLDEPPVLPEMPINLDGANATALSDNPSLQLARSNEEASRYGVKRSMGTMMPSIDAYASYSKQITPFANGFGALVNNTNISRSVGAQITVPLYQGGAEYSDIRRAKQVNNQRRLQILSAERLVLAQVRQSWEQYRAAISSISSNESQVRANEIALEGVRQEAIVGSRTTLDVLDAEQELLDSRVNLVRANRNYNVAGYTVLASIGRLNSFSLDLDVEFYDPEKNYKKVKAQFIGWGVN
ncbi:MAG: TolC family outer membrane protein [Sphingomonadales bacterium]